MAQTSLYSIFNVYSIIDFKIASIDTTDIIISFLKVWYKNRP